MFKECLEFYRKTCQQDENIADVVVSEVNCELMKQKKSLHVCACAVTQSLAAFVIMSRSNRAQVTAGKRESNLTSGSLQKHVSFFIIINALRKLPAPSNLSLI